MRAIALCCKSGGERISRHNPLRDQLPDTAAVAAGVGPRKGRLHLVPGPSKKGENKVNHRKSHQKSLKKIGFYMPEIEGKKTHFRLEK